MIAPHEIAPIDRPTIALRNLMAEFDRYDAEMMKIGRGHEDYGRQREEARQALDSDLPRELLARLKQVVRYMKHPESFLTSQQTIIRGCEELIARAQGN